MSFIRVARKDLVSNYLHIMVQGINREYIFNTKEDILKYLNLLTTKLSNIEIIIIAYCMMNNHAHFLMYSESKEEISKLMRKVNTAYAIYYNKKHNRVGYVFRDRFKSEEIVSRAHLISCINYIHNNPVKAGICNRKQDYDFSSYNDYKYRRKFVDEILIEKCLKTNGIDINYILENNYSCNKFIETYEINDKIVLRKNAIDNFLKDKNMNIEDLTKNNKYLRELSLVLYNEYNLTQKEIGKILGVNRLKIHRLIHKNEL